MSNTSFPKQVSNSSLKSDSQRTLNHLDIMTLELSRGTDTVRVAEPEKMEIYDRESILYELADPGNLAAIRKLERMHGRSPIAEDANGATKESREFLTKRLRETLQTVPDTMLHILTGRNRPGDCGRPRDQKPDWLDMDKLRRGQKFARDHMFSIFFSEMLGAMAMFSFEDLLKPLIMTQKSSTPYTAFKRYLSMGRRTRHWYTEDPWAKGSAAWKDILVVRAMHSAVKRKLDSMTKEEMDAATRIPDPWSSTGEILLKDFSEECAAPVIGQCPYIADRNSPDRFMAFSQAEMVLGQWIFMGFITLFPKRVGVHYATDEDLEAFCHLWRSIGYQLGMEDEFNYCRGTLEEIRQRNRDFVETWVKPNLREITPEWEHMLRCIFTGMSVVLPSMTFEIALLHLTEILDLQTPRLYASLSYKDWITYNLVKYFINHAIKLPKMSGLINFVLNRALDRAEKFTPEDLQAVRIKLSDYRGSVIETRDRDQNVL